MTEQEKKMAGTMFRTVAKKCGLKYGNDSWSEAEADKKIPTLIQAGKFVDIAEEDTKEIFCEGVLDGLEAALNKRKN